MLNTLKRLFTSRKWLVAAGTFVVATGVIAAGWDERAATETADKIVNIALTLAALFIGTTAFEDAASKLHSPTGKGQ